MIYSIKYGNIYLSTISKLNLKMLLKHLTEKQKQVYLFIRDYILSHKHSPYIREIQEALGISSHKSVIDRLLALEKKGYIKRKLNKHRSIVLSKNNYDTQTL